MQTDLNTRYFQPATVIATLALSAAILLLLFPLSLDAQKRSGKPSPVPELEVGTLGNEGAYRLFYAVMGKGGKSDTSHFASIRSSHELFLRHYTYKVSMPILPMVFFDQGSSIIPPRYQILRSPEEVAEYKEWSESVEEMGDDRKVAHKYYEILNIIGSRMARFPKTRIVLRGGYSTREGESPSRGAGRVAAVRDYLAHFWNVDPSRITSHIDPPDSTGHLLKQQENESVTILSDDWKILRPVTYIEARPDEKINVIPFFLRINPRVNREDLRSVTLLISSGEEVLSTTEVPLSSDSTTYTFLGLWVLPRRANDLEDHLTVKAVVTTARGASHHSEPSYISIERWYRSSIDDTSQFNPGVETSEPYREDILFYESGDTVPGPLQLQMLEQRLAALKESIRLAENVPEGKWTIHLSSHGEASEDPEIDSAQLRAEDYLRRSKEEYLFSLLNVQPIQVPLYLMPFSMEKIAEHLRSHQKTFGTDVARVWLGERVDEINAAEQRQREWSRARKDFSQLYQLWEARAVSAEEWITSRIDTSLMNIEVEPAYMNSSPELLSFPEARYYRRYVRLFIVPPYNETEGDLWDMDSPPLRDLPVEREE